MRVRGGAGPRDVQFFVAARASTCSARGEVRAVVHHTADTDDAGAWIGGKGIDDRLRPFDRRQRTA